MKLKHIVICLLACFIGLSTASNINMQLPLEVVKKLNAEHKKTDQNKLAKKHKKLKGSPNVTVIKQKFIPISKQHYTPSSIQTRSLQGNVKVSRVLKTDNSCFQLVAQSGGQNYSIQTNPAQWWSTGSITYGIQNTCSTPQSLSGMSILFGNLLMNGSPITSGVSTAQISGNPYLTTSVTYGSSLSVNLSTPACAGAYCSWAQVAPNAILTLNVNGGYSGLMSSLTLGSISIAGATPPPPPPAPGELDVNVTATSLQTYCQANSCNIQMQLLDSGGNIVESGTINPATMPTASIQFQNILPGQYTMYVVPSSLPNPPSGSMMQYTYAPAANITVASNTTSTGNITFVYTPATPTGSVYVNLATVSQASTTFANIGNMRGQLVDQTTNNTLPFTVGLGGNTTINNLVIGHSYGLQLQGIADPVTGVYYAPVQQTIVVNSSTTIVQNITYTRTVGTSLITVPFVEQVAKGGLVPTTPLSLSFASNNSYYKYNNDTMLNSVTLTFDNNDSIAVTSVAPIGYTVSSTNPFVLSTGSANLPTQTITLQAVSSSNLMVGYLSNSYGIGQSVYTTYSQAAAAGYNVVIGAFAVLQNTAPVTWYGDQFLAYTSWQTFSACPVAINTVIQDIANAKQYYGLKYALASVGGGNSTINISGLTTQSSINTAAQNIVNFLQQYTLDGIDFDIEQTQDPTILANLLTAIRAINPNILITAPPQANSVGSGTTQVAFVTTGTDQGFSTAISQGLFDYLWLQAYNTGNTSNQIMYNGSLVDETMPEYIPASYYYFMGQLSAQPPVTVPNKTKFLIGEPAQVDAGGLATIWHNPNYSVADMYQALAQNYTIISNVSSGAMVWSINQDIDEGCLFSSSVGAVFGFKNIVCPTNGDTYHGTLNPNNC